MCPHDRSYLRVRTPVRMASAGRAFTFCTLCSNAQFYPVYSIASAGWAQKMPPGNDDVHSCIYISLAVELLR